MQAAIRALEEQATEMILLQHGQRIGQSNTNAKAVVNAQSLETSGGPARI
jgi:hypothetical protein